MEVLNKLSRKKTIALLTLFIMIINMFSPYAAFAAYVENGQTKYNAINISDIQKVGSNYMFYVEFLAIGDCFVGSFDVSMKYDTTLFEPANKDTGASNSTGSKATKLNDLFTFQTKTAKNGTIRMTGTTTSWYEVTEEGDPSVTYSSELSIFRVYLRLKDPSKWKLDGSNEITTDMVWLNPTASLETGYKQRIAADDNGTNADYVTSLNYLATKGYKEAEKNITQIVVKTNPTKVTYDHGDNIDLTGGKITVKYDDNSEEDIDMTDTKVTIKSGSPADVNDPTVKIDYKGNQTTFNITVNDPVDSLVVKTPMTKYEYTSEDNTLDFTGLELTATKRSGATENLTATSAGLNISETTASITSPNFTKTSPTSAVVTKGTQKIYFTYQGQTAMQTIIVNDTISSISLISQPTKTAYKYGETVNFSGAVVKVLLGSTNTTNINLPDGSVTVDAYDNTSTGSIQQLSVSFGGKTATDKINVEFYDYVKSSSLVDPNKVDYIKGEALSVAGGKLKLTTAKNQLETINLTDAMVSGYNANQLGTQTITVEYTPEYTLANGTKINGDKIIKTYQVEVTDDVTNFVINGAPTDVKYNDNLNLSAMTLTVTRESGPVATPIPVTSTMISGFTKTTLGPQTVNVTYEGVTKTFNITVKDYVDSITLSSGANSKTFNSTTTSSNALVIADELNTSWNDLLNDNNIKYAVKYASKTSAETAVALDSKIAISPTYSSTKASETYTLTYTDTDTNLYAGGNTMVGYLKVNLSDKVTKIEITKINGKTYTPGTAIDVKYGVDFDVEFTKKHADSANNETGLVISTDSSKSTNPTGITLTWQTGKNINTLGDAQFIITDTSSTESDTGKVKIKDWIEEVTISPDTVTDNLGTSVADVISHNNIKYRLKLKQAGLQNEVALNVSMVNTSSYSTTSTAQQTLTVSYTNTDSTLYIEPIAASNTIVTKTPLKITLSDAITGITINKVNGVAYTQGARIDVKYDVPFTIEATVVHANAANNQNKTYTVGTSSELSWTTGGITTMGNGTIKITEGTIEKSVDVLVKNWVNEITLNKATINANYGDSLSSVLNGLEYTVDWKKDPTGGETGVQVTTSNVDSSTVYDSTKATQTLNIKYQDKDANSYTYNQWFTKPITINLTDTVKSVTITKINGKTYTPGTPIDVKYGVDFDVEIAVVYAKAPSETKTISTDSSKSTNPAGYTLTWQTGKGINVLGEGQFVVTNTASKEADTGKVTVKDYVKDIALNKATINGTLGDSLSTILSGLTYTVDWANATDTTNNVTSADIDATTVYNSSLSTQTLKIKYTDTNANSATKDKVFEKSITINLSDAVTGIEITKVNGKTYTLGTPINVKYNTAFSIVATIKHADAANNETKTFNQADSEVSWTTGSLTSLGAGTLKVEYGGKSDTANVNVQDYVTDIKLSVNGTVGASKVSSILNTEFNDLVTSKNIKYIVNYAKAGDKTAAFINDGKVSISPTYNKTAESQSLDITYTDNDVDSYTKTNKFTKTLAVTLTDVVKKVEITKINGVAVNAGTPTNINYDTAFTIEAYITYANSVNNKSITFNNTDPEVSWTVGSLTNLGAGTLKVEYGGESDTTNVNIKDYITGVVVQAPTKTKYNWTLAGSLDLTGGSVKTVMASGATGTPVSLDDASVTLSTFKPNQEGKQTITVTYEGFNDKSFEVEVIDEIHSITINNAPSTVDYGKTIDLTNTTITVIKDSIPEGTSIPVKEEMLSSYDNTKLDVTQTITVSFGGKTDTFEITVNDYVVDFVLTAPSKTNYECGENLDLSDGYITKITASGNNTQTVPLTDSKVSITGYDSSKLGVQTVTVTYEGKTKTFGVTVSDNIQSISIDVTPKTSYKYGEKLDVTGGTINVNKSSGTTKENITNSMVSGYDPTKLGTQTITVSYGGKTTTYQVQVSDYADHITITPPTKLLYNVNEKMDLTGGKVSVIMASGKVKETVDMISTMIKGFDTSTTGAKTITVTHPDLPNKPEHFSITVQDPLSEMIIETLPNKLNYLYGEKLDVTGGTIKLVKTSGIETIIPMTENMITGFTSKTLGQVTLTVTEEGFTQEFVINVSDYEKEANFVTPTKTTYEYGEELDVTGGTVSVVMASGKVKEKVDITASMISGFDNKKVGQQTLTIKYKDYTKTFKVTIVDKVGGIALNSEPTKTKYEYGEKLDVTGGTIKVIKTSGTVIEDITPEMVSGYDANKSGYQVITVTYEGYKTEFVVYVYPKVAPSTPSTPEQTTPTTPTTTKPSKPSKPSNPVEEETKLPEENIVPEEPVIEEPIIEEPIIDNTNENNVIEEKPTITLGEKDKEGNVNTKDNKKIAAVILLVVAFIFLLLLLNRKNVKIYVEEDGEFVLGGKDKIGKNNPKIDVNEYLDGNTINNQVKLVLNDNISEKLDGKEITITHRDKTIKVKIKYENKPVEIILEALNEKL